MDVAVTLAVGLLGGGTLATIVGAWLNRRKVEADTGKTSVEATSIAVDTMKGLLAPLNQEIDRVSTLLIRTRGELVVANEIAVETRAAHRQCEADLIELRKVVAANTVRVDQIVHGQQTASASSDLLRQAGIDILERVQQVSDQVATGNSQTLGMLADQVERRRVEDIPVDERTTTEQGHVDKVSEPE